MKHKTEYKMIRSKDLNDKFSKKYRQENNKLDAQRHHERN
jgi:hypothetical protein